MQELPSAADHRTLLHAANAHADVAELTAPSALRVPLRTTRASSTPLRPGGVQKAPAAASASSAGH